MINPILVAVCTYKRKAIPLFPHVALSNFDCHTSLPVYLLLVVFFCAICAQSTLTPLYEYVRHGDSATAEFLIAAGADVHAVGMVSMLYGAIKLTFIRNINEMM